MKTSDVILVLFFLSLIDIPLNLVTVAAAAKSFQSWPDSTRAHRRQPTRLPRPWDSPGNNTGVGCHFLFQCVKVKSLSRVRLLVIPWTAAHQAPPSMGFSRQEYWSGLSLPSPKNNNVRTTLNVMSIEITQCSLFPHLWNHRKYGHVITLLESAATSFSKVLENIYCGFEIVSHNLEII